MADLNPNRENIPPSPYKFSADELRILSKCNRESFYQRSLPLATIMGLATYWSVKAGYLRPSPKWGASMKVGGAVMIGYFLGKLSYQQKCAEMIMQLPNSELAKMLRNRRRGGGSAADTMSIDPSFGTSPFSTFGGLSPKDTSYTDLDARSTYTDLDVDRPLNDGLNDSFRPSIDNNALDDENALPLPTPGPPVTYEDLRRKNREEYVLKNTKPYRGVPSPNEVPSTVDPNSDPFYPNVQPPLPPSRPQQGYGAYKEKNRYGDEWEK